MVEGNENQTNEPESGSGAPKRRGGLFGARRGGRGKAIEQRRSTDAAVAEAPAVTDAPSGQPDDGDCRHRCERSRGRRCGGGAGCRHPG